MATSSPSWLRAATVLALATSTVAQQCYYPNGSQAPKGEKPCSSAQGSACCPESWQCLDNGLCYYPPDNLHGRYSCTDKNWDSPGCPSNMCTYDMNAVGGESITQCSNHNNNWCCNADATHVDCCQESPEPRPFFRLQDGKAYATIGSNQASSVPTLSSISGLASGSASDSSPSPSKTPSPSSSREPSSANANSETSASPTPITSVGTSVTPGPTGPETVYVTAIITPPSNPTSAASDQDASTGDGSNKSKIGLIVGCAVGIPLGLALIGILAWMLRKRRQQKMHPYKDASGLDGESSSPEMAAAALGKQETYRHSRPGTSEIDSQPVGPGRPISTLKGHAELDSGTSFRPDSGAPYAPDTAFIGGGNGDRSTWSSAPPNYSPGQVPASWGPPEGIAELDSSSVMPVIAEGEQEQEQTPAPAQTQQYQAYRPPPSEMNAMKTPPEDLEKQLRK